MSNITQNKKSVGSLAEPKIFIDSSRRHFIDALLIQPVWATTVQFRNYL